MVEVVEMTEDNVKYENEISLDINHVQLYLSDIEAVEIYINRNREATQLPEAVYSALSALISAWKGR